MLKTEAATPRLVEDFHRDGFVCLRNALTAESLAMLEQDIHAVASRCFSSKQASFDLKNFRPDQSENRRMFYNLLRYVPALSALSGCVEIQRLSKTLGLDTPVVMKACNIRMDLPYEDEFLFHWHQDITYLLGSLNSITYWMPLTPVNRSNGTIEVLPGTHRGGVLPFEYTGRDALVKSKVMSPKDIRLSVEPTESGVFIEAEPGDVVIFSQLLLHRSTPNRSSSSRWSVQIRHTDIDRDFIAAGCPLGDRGNIYSHRNYYDLSTADTAATTGEPPHV